MGTRYTINSPARSRQRAGGKRKPGNEADAVGGTVGEHVLTATVDQVVTVLHCRHGKHAARGLDLGHRYFAQSRVTDDAFVQQLPHGAELLFARHARVDSMKLPETDLIDAELS